MTSKMDRNGTRKSLVLCLILILVMLGSMFISSTDVVVYPLIILLLYILKRKEGGFQWGISWKPGFIFGFVLMSLIFLLESWLGWIKIGNLYSDTFKILSAYIIFELFVSVGEELSFRGYILPNLIASLGVRNAVITTSLLFAGLHIPSIFTLNIGPFNSIVMFTTITAAGILLALLYLIDGLKMACGFHFSWNFFQYHIFSLRTGFGIFSLTAAKPEFTGGNAGPEAGLLGLAVLFLGILILLAFFPCLRKE